MILFIIGALFALIALAVLIFSDDAKRAAIIPAVVAVIFIGISCVSYVPTGYTGIVTTFGKVEDLCHKRRHDPSGVDSAYEHQGRCGG